MSGHQIVLSFYQYPKRIAEAKRILNAEEEDSGSPIFPALASILFAVALEDGINSVLADRYANAAASEQSNRVFEPLQGMSLRQRMTALAEIVTHGFFGAPDHREHGKALHELVSLRNRLLHVDEAVHSLDERSAEVTTTENHVEIRVKIPQDPWSQVTKRQAEKFGRAIDLYVQEILIPLSDMAKY